MSNECEDVSVQTTLNKHDHHSHTHARELIYARGYQIKNTTIFNISLNIKPSATGRNREFCCIFHEIYLQKKIVFRLFKIEFARLIVFLLLSASRSDHILYACDQNQVHIIHLKWVVIL